MSKTAKKIYIGWSPARGNPRIWEFFNVPNLMVNAFDFWDRNQPINKIKSTLQFKGEVFCDSGGYQILNGRKDISIQQILELQLRMKASLNAVLDNALDYKEHIRNLKTYTSFAEKNPRLQFVPVVPHDLPKSFLKKMVDIFPQPAVIAIGNVVPSLYPLSDQKNLLSVLKNIQSIKHAFSKSKIHIFGLGGLTTAALFFYLIDSTDSTAWVHDARFGKLRILGGGVARTTRPKSVQDFFKKNNCGCPICDKNNDNIFTEKGTAGTQKRAIHNAWVLLKELKLLNLNLSRGTYDEFISQRIQKSPWHRSLFRAVKQMAG